VMKKHRLLVLEIDPQGGLQGQRDASEVISSGSEADSGAQQRHTADIRPSRLRGRWRPERLRHRAVRPRVDRGESVGSGDYR
jgi:hypothetical protein